jgi:uncharacterized membrane protein YsdA (DUF1294 family)
LLALAAVTISNLLAFFAQGLDKWRAKRRAARTSERTLLLLGLPLAAPGMWLGMRAFRHKTSKRSFLLAAWLVTGLNLGLLWLLIEAGRRGWIELGPWRAS